MNLKKYLKYLIIPIVVVLLAVPLVLTGCSSGDAADNTTQTPFDLLKNRVSTVEGKISQVEANLAGLDLGNIDTIESNLTSLLADFNSLVDAFDLLLIDIAALVLRVDVLEEDGGEPDEESTLALTIVGGLPTIINTSENVTFSIFVENEGTKAASGQVVLQLNVQGAAAEVESTAITGDLTFPGTTYVPSQSSCTEITFISGHITLASGQSRAYAFTLVLKQGATRWWIPTLEIAN